VEEGNMSAGCSMASSLQPIAPTYFSYFPLPALALIQKRNRSAAFPK
jgi:hypothetical protein